MRTEGPRGSIGEQHPLTSIPNHDDQSGKLLIPLRGWLSIGVLGLLFAVLHRHFLVRMFRIATGEFGGDWSHALILPLISGYFISQNRDRLVATGRRIYWPGLVILFAGMLSFAWCIYPVRNDMLQGYSMILSLFGLVLFLVGPGMMRVLWFPIVYLILGVKISDRFWEQIALKLQMVAAGSAAFVMQLLGVDASVRGSTIDIAFMRDGQWVIEGVDVDQACSGLRMLMAFIALGAAMAYLVERAWWKRVLMVLLAVPIAVVVNVARVTAVGLLSMYDKEMASGDFHVFVGMLMLIPAAGLFMLVGWVLDHLVIDDDEPSRCGSPKAVRLSRSDVSGAQGGWPMRDVAKGMALGVALTTVIGIEYGLLLASYRPADLFGGWLSGLLARGLFLAGLGLLATGLWWVRNVTRPAIGPGPAAASVGVGAGVLLAAVVGLNGVVQATRTVLIKHPLPVRLPLYQLPEQVGSWEMIDEEPPLSVEHRQALGTNQYTSRRYRDTSAVGETPTSRVRLHVAYYTGTPDTVPHVPDRCFVGGGLVPVDLASTTISVSGPSYRYQDEDDWWVAASRINPDGVRLPDNQWRATVFTFSDPSNPALLSNVIYFFVANGKFLATPEWVRAEAFDPRDRYSYYCKVEVALYGVADPQEASGQASAFLSAMMPEIMACLPDWVDVTEGRWPPQAPSR